jgi:hypothetical protein
VAAMVGKKKDLAGWLHRSPGLNNDFFKNASGRLGLMRVHSHSPRRPSASVTDLSQGGDMIGRGNHRTPGRRVNTDDSDGSILIGNFLTHPTGVW